MVRKRAQFVYNTEVLTSFSAKLLELMTGRYKYRYQYRYRYRNKLEKYRQRLSDILLGRAVGDELVQGDLAVVVQVHRFEDLGDVRLRRLAADGRRVAHQLVDRVGHL